MWNDFKAFLFRGNVVDLAIAVIMGAAFGAIVTSLVNDLLMPPLGLVLGRVDFAELFVSLDGKHYASLAAAKAAGAATINYGRFLNTVVSFVLIAFAVFVLVRQVNRFMAKPPATPTTKECPYCIAVIPRRATRCPQCTSAVNP